MVRYDESEEAQLTLTLAVQRYITLNKSIASLHKELVEKKVERNKLEVIYRRWYDDFEDLCMRFMEDEPVEVDDAIYLLRE
jgi:hypothetical protein